MVFLYSFFLVSDGAGLRFEQTDDLQVYKNGGVSPTIICFV